MDPIAHTFTGAALATAGLRRITPLATAALLIGANVPDVDVLASFAGEFRSLELRRGWTHGVLALALWPFIVTALLVGWHRWRLRAVPQAPPIEPRRLLVVAGLAVLTHPTLDWLNNYGMRWLMPFDDRWFYGDALFIVDPWVWLALGGVTFLRYSTRPSALAAWIAFWSAATWLVWSNAPWPAGLVWSVGVVVLLGARFASDDSEQRRARAARAAVIAVSGIGLYMVAALLANLPAERHVQARLEGSQLGPIDDIMVAPVPGDPFGGFVVVEANGAYHLGDWHWFAEPRLAMRKDTIPTRLEEPAVRAAMQAELARRFLVWSRFPYAEVEQDAHGFTIHWADARYSDNARLVGPSLRLDLDLKPLNGDPP